ncbi:MAG: maleylpyruvate isomerase family mycothiol-dependent enzyme [Acidimicrobiia bacterium]
MVVVPDLRMSHEERVGVIADHCAFFAGLAEDDLAADVPGCPGWSVEDVLRHVAAFSASCRAWCQTSDLGDVNPMVFNMARMAEVQQLPLEALVPELDAYRACLANLDADAPVYGHLGVETAGWQSWHCAAEWGVHRHDVEVGLGRPSSLTGDRAFDAVMWTIEYAYPMVLQFRGLESFPAVRLVSEADGLDHVAGAGAASASLSGTAQDLVLHLWRRPHGPVIIEGDPVAAREYSGLAAGR